MGIFDKIGDVLGDVVDGVVDFVDDVLGIELHKIMDNDFVKYGLMAASLFTGGVAIVNGVVQGAGAAAAAKGFAASFVEGAKGFVQGVASGIANPMKTAGDLTNQASTLMSGNAGAQAAAGRAGQEAALASTPQSLLADGGDIAANLADEASAGSSLIDPASRIAGGADPGFSLSDMGQTDFNPNATDFQMGGSPSNVNAPGFDPAAAAAPPAPGGGGIAESVSQGMAEPAQKDFLGSFLDGAKDFATSPMGMQTLTGMAQGYASGAAMEERWNMMQEEERRRRRSWEGFGSQTPNYADIPSLRQLRERSRQMMGRADEARANSTMGWSR